MSKNNYKYRFTLFTPCYNSAKFIDRMKTSVEGQTFKNFEWIIVNDNSSDNTLEILREYIKTVNFPVKLINNTQNLMLAANYNIAMEQAEGEYFVTLDHDDEYSSNYLEIMDELIKKYDSPKVAGVVARCKTQYGKVTPTIEYKRPIMGYWEYAVDRNGHYLGEVPRAFKSDILRNYIPFDPEEVHNPVIEAMMSYDGYSFITTNEIIRVHYRYEDGHASVGRNMNKLTVYNWRRALRELNDYYRCYNQSIDVQFNWILKYAADSIRLGLSYSKAINALKRRRLLVSLVYPLAAIKVALSKNEFIHGIWQNHLMMKEVNNVNK